MKDIKEKIIELLERERLLTASEIAQMLGIPATQLKNILGN